MTVINVGVSHPKTSKAASIFVDLGGFPTEELGAAVQKLRETIPYDKDILSVLRKIKESSPVKLYLVSNISSPDYLSLRERWGEEFWSLFDDVYTSSMVGERKPSLKFFRHVLRATRSTPERTIFIDDRPENNLVAASLGMRPTFGIEDLGRVLTNILHDPVERGLQFLKRHAKQHHTGTQDGQVIDEVYAQLLILEETKNP